MSFRPHKFGRYIIVDPIAVGGMAEIYRARVAAAKEGPDRVLVIKKVIANLSQNTEFIQMFEEEIKITVGLTHPNIIQIYDYGQVDNQYFMAMEYVEGKNLRQFVKRLVDMKSMFSIDMSCHIISQTCQALGYAHAYKDRMSGKPLGIVHRDISPQNVMISYDGAVKLFDFGIAKAKSANDATRAGVIKGKPSYLSPEQINGEELDGRCDIFALGIVLWELLTAKRLFVAETDMGVLRLIQSAKIEPPSTFNPAVPQALNSIVLKSLARDKTKRYQTAEEFQRDLHKFLYSFNPNFNPADLSYYAQEIFKQEIREDRERLQKYLAMDPLPDEATPGKPEKVEKKPAASTKMAEGLLSTTDFNREMLESVYKDGSGTNDKGEKGPSIERSEKSLLLEVHNKRMGKTVVPGGPKNPVKNISATGSVHVPTGNTEAKISSLASQVEMAAGMKKTQSGDSMVIPPWSKQTSKGSRMTTRPTGTSTSSREIHSEEKSNTLSIAVAAVLFFGGGLFAARQFGWLAGTPLSFLDPGRKIASDPQVPVTQPTETPKVEETAVPPQPKVSVSATEGVIVFQSDLPQYSVTVDGNPVTVNNNQVSVPGGRPIRIEVKKYGYDDIRFETKVAAGTSAAFRLEFKHKVSGILFLSTNIDSQLTIYEGERKVMEFTTPVKNAALPVGTYKAVLENKAINYHEQFEITLEENKIVRIDKILK